MTGDLLAESTSARSRSGTSQRSPTTRRQGRQRTSPSSSARTARGRRYIFTDYLGAVSPEWKSKVGVSTAVKWPVGIGGKGNEGVAGQVKQTPDAIGYVEVIYALQNKLGVARSRTRPASMSRPSSRASPRPRRGVRTTCRPTCVPRSSTPRARAPTRSRPSPGCSSTRPRTTRRRRALPDFMRWNLPDGQKFARTSATRRCPAGRRSARMEALINIKTRRRLRSSSRADAVLAGAVMAAAAGRGPHPARRGCSCWIYSFPAVLRYGAGFSGQHDWDPVAEEFGALHLIYGTLTPRGSRS